MLKHLTHTNRKSIINTMNLVFILILLCLINSCDKKYINIHDFEYNKWPKFDTIDFDFNINDTTKTYDLSFFFRNSINYTYRNLFLLIDLNHNGKIIQIDTVEYKIADKYGKWLGRGLGNMKDNYLIFNENMMFNNNGIYKIRIRHGMRQDPLLGVNKLGLQIK